MRVGCQDAGGLRKDWGGDGKIRQDSARSGKLQGCSMIAFYWSGVKTTIPFHTMLVKHEAFLKNKIHTRWIEEELINQNGGKQEYG